GNLRRLRRVFHADEGPAHLALVPRARLVKVIIPELERCGVRILVPAVKDANDVELPEAAAVSLAPNGRLDGHLIPDLPMKPHRGLAANDRPRARFEPRLLLFGCENEFGVHVEEFL